MFVSKGFSQDEPTPEHLAETMECVFSAELSELAGKLNNDPVEIFNWVYENIEFEDYYDSRKGAQSTYFTKRGNEWDQSSLLIALLRLSGIPARYVQVGDYDRVYVESWLPTSNYRGLGNDGHREWIPLVPWIKDYREKKGLDLFPEGVIAPELNFDFNNYLSSVKQKTALELYEEQLQDYLTNNHPGKTLKDTIFKKIIINRRSSVLPSSLPLEFYNYGTEKKFAVVSNSDRVQSKVRIEKYSDNSPLMERIIYLPEIANSRLVLDFIPASGSDAQIIAGYGTMCQTPEGQAQVKPVLRLDGQIIQEGLPIVLGEYFIWSHEIQGKRKVRPRKQAGTLMAIGFDALSVSVELMTKLKEELNGISINTLSDDATREMYLGRYAAIFVNTFLSRKQKAIERATNILYSKRNYGPSLFPTLVYVFPNSLSSDSRSKYLIHPSWNIDASTQTGSMYKQDSDSDNFFPLDSEFGGFSSKLYMFSASYNEGLIFEDWQDTPGGNTIKALMQANEQGIPVVDLTSQSVIDGHLPILETQTENRYSDYLIDSIIESLKEEGTTIKTPVRRVIYSGLDMTVQLKTAPSYVAYLFNMNHGGGSDDVVYDDIPVCDSDGCFYVEEICDSNGCVEVEIEAEADVEIPSEYEDEYSNVDEGEGANLDNYETGVIIDNSAFGAELSEDGDPVDLVKGEFYQDEKPDILIKSRGYNLEVKRKYKSQLVFNGPFGYGWTWAHMNRILPALDGSLVYYNSSGVASRLVSDGNGGFKYPAGATFTVENITNTYILTEKDQSKIYFSDKGLLTKKEDRYGNTLTFEYNQQDKISQMKDSLNRSLSFTYNADGKIIKVEDFTGRFCTYEYDGKDLIAFTDLEGNTTQYEYLKNQDNPANNHNMSRYILPNGDYLEIGYYKNDQVSHHTNKKGETFSFQYSRLNQYAETWNEEGYYRKVFYNKSKDVIRTTVRDKTIERKEYDQNHNVLLKIDGNGFKTSYTYDENRNMTSKKNALGEEWLYEYDLRFSKKSKITDPKGNITIFEYDDDGNLTTKKDALGNETIYMYDQYGNNTSITDPLGNTITKTYDGFGINLVKKSNKRGHESMMSYNLVGNMMSLTNPMGHTTGFEYNNYNQKTKIIDALGNDTRFEYDINRKLTKKIAANGAITENIYDSARDIVTGALISQTIDALGSSQFFNYDAVGNKIRAEDRNGNSFYYRYDELKRKIEKIDPFLNSTSYKYDGSDNLISETTTKNAETLITQYSYDAAGRLVLKTDPKGYQTSYTYDANGKPITEIKTVNSHAVTTTYEYDQMNRLVRKILGQGTTEPRIYQYYYDSLGKKVKSINPLGHETIWNYDADSNVTSITRTQNSQQITDQFFYDTRNLLIKKTDAKGNEYRYEYDALGRKSADIDPLGFRVEYFYDSVGNLIETVDQLGNKTRHIYDLAGRKIKTINALGNSKSFSYDNNGNLTSVKDEDSNTSRFYYDALNRKIAVENALGATTTSDFDETGNLIAVTDPLGNTTRFEYDNNNNRISETKYFASGSVIKLFQYDELNRLVKATDARGNDILLSYNAFNEITNSTNALNQTIVKQFDLLGRLVNTTDAKGISTINTYDETGHIVKVIQAAGTAVETITRFEYDKNGNRTAQIRDNDGQLIVKNFTYDARNKLVSEISTNDSKVLIRKYEFDTRGQIVKTIDPKNNETLFSYDALGRRTEITDADSNTTELRYDKRSNLVMEIKPEGETIVYTFDAINRKTGLNIDGSRKDWIYDANNRLIEEINLNRISTTYQYDRLGRLLQKTEAEGKDEEATTKYSYDKNGNLLTITNANNAVVVYEYDVLNRRIKESDADNTFQTVQYDVNSNLIVNTKRDGNVIEYSYDSLNRKTQTDADGQTEQSFAYDSLSRMTSATDFNQGRSSNTTQYEYDDLHRVTAEIQNGTRIEKEYDDNSNPVKLIYPSGREVTKAYTSRNKLLSIVDTNGAIATFEYNNNGHIKKTNLANGIEQTFGYDGKGRETTREYKLSGDTLYAMATEYDDQGNILKESIDSKTQNTPLATQDLEYSYDNLDRLTKDKTRDNTWLYDRVGNWVFTNQNGTDEFRTSNSDNEYTDIGGIAPVHDPNGNMISDGTRLFEYDWANRLIKVTDGGLIVAEYTYDALNRRVTKTLPQASRQLTYYYDKNQVIEEHENGTLERSYVYGSFIDDPIEMDTGGSKYYYLKDRKYSITALADESGNVIERYEYTSFGKRSIFDAGNNSIQNSQFENPYGYTGRRWDSESELWYYRNRMYSPILGRFLQRDPAGYIDGLNLYAYVKNNPIKFYDSLGLSPNFNREISTLIAETWQDSNNNDHVTAGLIYGHDTDQNISVKVGYIDMSRGENSGSFSTGMSYISFGNDEPSNTKQVQTFSVEYSAGTDNKDLSSGYHSNASITIVGYEFSNVLDSDQASSFSFGLAAAIGWELSFGTRDLDKDGDTEHCFRIGIKAISAGLCWE